MPEAVIVDAVRTPIGRYGGALGGVRPDDLAALVLSEIVRRNDLSPAIIDDVYLGCANQAGEDNRNVARMAVLLAGLPKEVPGVTVNRLCASGLEAVALACCRVLAGQGEVFIAGGVESMSRAPFVLAKAERSFDRGVQLYDSTLGWRFINKALQEQYGTLSMGETAEEVARHWGVSRADQDAYASSSQQRCAEAVARGRLRREIVPVPVPGPSGETRLIDADEHPRPATTPAQLAKLAPAFRPDGSVTAGNSAGINDGAAVLLITSARRARQLGLRPLARFVTYAAAGVLPSHMGIGPVPATQKVLQQAELTVDQLDVIELNEAFAAQVLAAGRELGLCWDRVNVNGGAIALGHPLGMTGARLAATLAYELDERRGRYGLATLCVGVGQGVSLLLERR